MRRHTLSSAHQKCDNTHKMHRHAGYNTLYQCIEKDIKKQATTNWLAQQDFSPEEGNQKI